MAYAEKVEYCYLHYHLCTLGLETPPHFMCFQGDLSRTTRISPAEAEMWFEFAETISVL
jgi:hypothetical protein